jgi:hypothetical protein
MLEAILSANCGHEAPTSAFPTAPPGFDWASLPDKLVRMVFDAELLTEPGTRASLLTGTPTPAKSRILLR